MKWIAILMVLVLLGCSSSKENTEIANPASVYCQEQGGVVIINETPEGQAGYCMLDDIKCDEWAFYRGECGN